MTAIRDSRKHHIPPDWIRPTVERLLRSLAPEHTAAITAIVLTDSAAIGKGKTHRVGGRKYLRQECRGFYHAQSKKTGGAWIELVVDNIVPSTVPKWFLWFQLVRDVFIAKTLYHEIGHHLDATVGAATRGGEAAAEDWRKRLSRLHFRKRYWYLRPLVVPLRAIVRVMKRVRRRGGD